MPRTAPALIFPIIGPPTCAIPVFLFSKPQFVAEIDGKILDQLDRLWVHVLPNRRLRGGRRGLVEQGANYTYPQAVDVDFALGGRG